MLFLTSTFDSANFLKQFSLLSRTRISQKIADELFDFLCSTMQSKLVNQGELLCQEEFGQTATPPYVS